MESLPRFNIKRYPSEEIKILALNIFPQGKTVLHYAYKNLHIVRRFYKVIEHDILKQKQIAAASELEDTGHLYFDIPFMKDFDEKTPMHLCMDNENYKSADIILQKLCNDKIDSHSRAINDILPQLVTAELTSLGNYLDSRFAQTLLLMDFKRGTILKTDDLDYCLTTAELWPKKDELKTKVFFGDLDTEVKLEFLDVVGIHCYTEKVS